ncbi:MAG TPA: flagellar export protein FliJ [Solimonas sp.]
MPQAMSQRLVPLQQLADTREDEAARRLLDAQRQVAEREARLQELCAYRGEYEQRLGGATPQLMLNARQFIARLREAEAFQRYLVEQARQALATERGRWLLRRREAGTLEQLAEVYRGRERQVEARRQQKVLDEYAQRLHAVAAASGAC